MPPKSDVPRGSYAKNWILTVFDKEEWKWFENVEAKCRCWAFQEEECPKTGKRHLQAFISFDKEVWFRTLKSWMPTAHVEVCVSVLRAFEYCQKAESRVDGGFRGCSKDPPANESDGGVAGGRKRSGIELMSEFVRGGGDWEECKRKFPELLFKSESGMRKLYELYSPAFTKPVDGFKPDVVIMWGPPGSGKSSTARLMFGERKFFRMTIGKWADGYDYETGLLIDDMQPNLVPRAQLLVLMESGWCRWEVKGGTTLLNVQQVIITSNYDPLEWFPVGKEDKDKMHERGMAVIRRAKVFECSLSDEPVSRSAGSTEPADLAKIQKNQKSLLEMWKAKPFVFPTSADLQPRSSLSSSSSSSAML